MSDRDQMRDEMLKPAAAGEVIPEFYPGRGGVAVDPATVIAKAAYDVFRGDAPEWTEEYVPDNETQEEAFAVAEEAVEALRSAGLLQSPEGREGHEDTGDSLADTRARNGVYVAGRTGAIDEVRAAQRVCEESGYHITFDWTGAEGEIRKDWSMKAERACELASCERQAIIDADLLVLVWTEAGGVGNLLETGMAMALGRRVIILGPARESVFWYLPNVERVDNLTALRAALSQDTEGEPHNPDCPACGESPPDGTSCGCFIKAPSPSSSVGGGPDR